MSHTVYERTYAHEASGIGTYGPTCMYVCIHSCLALGDLLTVSQLDDVVPYLPDLWEMCLKVLDDIKVLRVLTQHMHGVH